MSLDSFVRYCHSLFIIATLFATSWYNHNVFAISASLFTLFLHTFIAYHVIPVQTAQLSTHLGFCFMSVTTFVWLLVDQVNQDGVNKGNMSLLLSVIFSAISMFFFLLPIFNYWCTHKRKSTGRYNLN